MYSVQMVSTTHSSLEAVSFKTAPSVGMVGRMHSKDREECEEPPMTQPQLADQPAVEFSC